MFTMEGLEMNLTMDVEGLDLQKVNVETMSTTIHACVAISAVIILLVNIMIIKSISVEKNLTFINVLVLLDCLDSIAHIPILVQFLL